MAIKSTNIIQELETKISVEKEKLYVLDLKEKIESLKQQRDDLLVLCKEFMEIADDGSARFDDPEPGSIYLRAQATIAKCEA